MALQKLTDLLNNEQAHFTVIQHSAAYTSQEIAESANISGRDLAKTVIVNIDGNLAMAVTRGSNAVDTEALRKATGARRVVVASEDEFIDRFPDCEIGAMPPFGELYGMEVFVSARLARDELICFNAGNHKELIQMSFEDFKNIVNPVLVEF